jgi:FAD:protein FMN transferase
LFYTQYPPVGIEPKTQDIAYIRVSIMITILIYFIFPFQVLTGKAQGTTYSIKYVAEKSVIQQSELDSIFHEIDESLSLYCPTSKINAFNEKGIVVMDQHMKKVITASLDCYRQSKGVFDITSATISSAWGFSHKSKHMVPDKQTIQKALSVTGSHLLLTKGDTLIASKPGVKIDCNGIAQGYTVDVISSYIAAKGITQFMVELGGEIFVKGNHPETEYWNIGIESPKAIIGNWYPVQEFLNVKDVAITTSGVNRNSFEVNGITYSHIIHPKKGTPIRNNIQSVTVISKSATAADAWDNTLLVMGLKKIKKLILKKSDMQVWVVYSDKRGAFQTFTNIKKGRLNDSLSE